MTNSPWLNIAMRKAVCQSAHWSTAPNGLVSSDFRCKATILLTPCPSRAAWVS